MTSPSVIYYIYMTNGDVIDLHNPAEMPEVVKIDKVEEPWIKATIIVPETYLGAVLALCEDKRGEQIDMHFMGDRAVVHYNLPLNEVVFDFFPSVCKGTTEEFFKRVDG